jgi:hypothetical protein
MATCIPYLTNLRVLILTININSLRHILINALLLPKLEYIDLSTVGNVGYNSIILPKLTILNEVL